MQKMTLALAALALIALDSSTQAQTLMGSRASMQHQNQLAVSYGYTFLDTPEEVSDFVKQGHLVRVTDTDAIELHDVSYPFARAEVKNFVERLSGQYYATCGEKLTITSLTRPIDEQPANASSDSVHPTGMAVDMRIPSSAKCRNWLERTLLSLESQGVLDVTRERHPAHLHVAVFTRLYDNYVASLNNSPALQPAVQETALSDISTPAADTIRQVAKADAQKYTVRKGDTLATIADRNSVSMQALRKANGLRGSKLKVGQKLQIPASDNQGAAAAQVVAKAAPREQDTTASSLLTHRVKPGETLWRIANRYGTSAASIKKLNGLKDDALQAGQLLRIGSLARNSLASSEP